MSIDIQEIAEKPEIVHSSAQSAADAKLLAYWENELDVPQAALAITQLGIRNREALTALFNEGAERWRELHTDLQQYTEGPNGFSVVLRQYVEQHLPQPEREAGPAFIPYSGNEYLLKNDAWKKHRW